MPQTQRRASDDESRDPSYRPPSGSVKKVAPAKKPAVGKPAPKEKRPSSELIADISAEKEEQERAKKAKTQAADNHKKALTCPITHAIFLEPVTMADGYTYEKRAAEEYIRSLNHTRRIVSPMTKKPMDNFTLTPNVVLRNAIEHAVDAGLLEGPDIDEYKAGLIKLAEEAKRLKALQDGARAGDAEACKDLGVAHMQGWYGLTKSDCEAVFHLKKAAEMDNVTGMALYGFMLIYGRGTSLRVTQGAMYIGMAAVQDGGSEFACSIMAEAYHRGSFNVPRDDNMARKFYEMMDNRKYKDADQGARDKRDEFLAPEVQIVSDDDDGMASGLGEADSSSDEE
ncbi:MAG: hypothetical protein CMB11_00035 [Euryarchaeota archaeon]|nr:hypothetical protein [Euryarchaeota archaeon]